MKNLEGCSSQTVDGIKNKKIFSNVIHKIGAKLNALALFVFFVPVLSFGFSSLEDGQAIFNVETKINVSYDGGSYIFTTNEAILDDALKNENIPIGEKDAVEPPRETRLDGGELDVRIIEALPYLVDDEGQKKIIFSGLSNEKEILKENGINLFDEDKISSSLISDFYLDNSLGLKIIIDRAPKMSIHVDGETKEVRSWLLTVGEILKEKNILVGNKDKVDPDFESYVFNGLEITITRVAESEVEELETIEFNEEVIEDINTFVGKDYIKQAGSSGTKKNIFKIISENGIMVSKTFIGSEIVKEPVKQIKVKGAKPYNATTLWPTIVAAASQYGVSASKMHSVMMCESGGNPYSGSFYKGLFQYHPDTWAGASSQYPGGVYRGASIYDPTAQIYVTAWKVSKQGWGAWGCA